MISITNNTQGAVVADQVLREKPTVEDGLEVKPDTITISEQEVSLVKFSTEDLDAVETYLAKSPDFRYDDIEDIYPCTPVQEGMLMSQVQGTEDYIIRATMELHPINGMPFDLERLQTAWESIIQQSPILRTIFVQSSSEEGLFRQVVVKAVSSRIREVQCDSLATIAAEAPSWEDGRVAPHLLTFCQTSQGPVGLKLEIHHGVSDAISSLHILHELMRLYDEPQSQLSGPQFRDFVQHLQNTPEEHKLNYWQEFLANTQPSLFPKLRISNPQKENLPQRCRREVKLDRDGILGLVASSKVSFSMFFHATWSVLLRAYLGKDDVAFGYISSGRHNVPLPKIYEALGPYISMMVARAQMDENPTFADLASQLRKNVANGLEHEQCSLASIQRKMQSNGGLFNTLVDVQRRPKLRRTSKEISLHLTHVHTIAEYDLVLNIEDTGDELLAKIDYKTSLLDEADVENVISCFLSIVDQVLQDPQRQIKALDLFTQVHRERVMGWNGAALPFTSASAHDLFDAEATRRPDADAVCSLDVNFTFGQLRTLSNRLASYLVSAGAGPGVMIPFCMEKSPWAIVSMMAIMKSGAAFVPIDPAIPAERFQGIIADTKAKLIIASQSTLKTIESMKTDEQVVITVDEDFFEVLNSSRSQATLRTLPAVDCHAPAYILFTSGSTGKPKGVVVPHESLCSSMYAHGPAIGIDENTRALQFAAYTFDAVIAEIFTVLVHGGCVCVPSEEDRMNNTTQFINELNVNWAMLTPTFARLLTPESIPSLRKLVLVGEAPDQSSLATWIGKVQLFNGYGPTETCVLCNAVCFSESLSQEPDPTIIGRTTGCRAWVVDPANHTILAPIGAVGELLIEGPSNAKGYLGDAEKTAKSFISAPSWSSGFELPPQKPFRFYRTGDLVRQLSNGFLKFCGRADNQTKVNGQRLEIGEVEHQLLRGDAVVQGVADVPKLGAMRGRLVAVLCLSGLVEPAEQARPLHLISKEQWAKASAICADLRLQLQSTLPAYMVPGTWIPVQKMPLLPSGKMDRRRIQTWLTTIDADLFKDISAFQTTGVEESEEDIEEFKGNLVASRLRAIWSEVLNVPEHTVGAQKPFLSLGGDSISAMRIVSKTRAQGMVVTVRDILHHRTILALTPHVQRTDDLAQARAPKRQLEGTRFPLSPIQTLYFQAIPDGTNHFNQSFLLQLQAPMESDVIRRAIDTLVARHSMLRARYSRDSEGTWWQTITNNHDWRFVITSSVPSLESVLPLFAASQTSLDAEQGPVLSVDFVTLVDGSQYLYMVAHHLVIDLVSWRTLFDDLEDELKQKKSQHIEPPAFQDWVTVQREHGRSLDPVKALPCQPLAADFDYWGMNGRSNVYADSVSTRFLLDEATTSALLGSANDALRTEPVELLMAIVLHSFKKQFMDRPVATLFTEGHGRTGISDDLDLSRTVGWFTSMFPIGVESSECTDLLQTIRRVKDARRGIPGQGIDYFTSRYFNESGRASFNDHQNMEILFNYQGLYQQLERSDSLLRNVSRTTIDLPMDWGKDVPRLSLFDIFTGVDNGRFMCIFTWSSNMEHQEEIYGWVKGCETLMQDFAQSTNTMVASLSDYPLLPFDYQTLDGCLQSLLPQWNLASLDEIEDIYPCSPSQEGMIVSQMRQPERNLYNFETVWKVDSTSGGSTNIELLEAACLAVIQRHQIMRTVFCETTGEYAPFIQVVFKNAASLKLPISRTKGAVGGLTIPDPRVVDSTQFPYHLALFETDDGIYCKFIINHCLLDGSCLRLLSHEITVAYGNLHLPTAPLYSSFIKYLLSHPTEESYAYWKGLLEDVDSCHFPSLNANESTEASLGHVDLEFTDAQVSGLRELCKTQGVTLATVMSTVWALVLRTYVGTETQALCFGYMASGRDVPVSGVHDMMGPLLNMMVQRVDVEPSMTIASLLQSVYNGVVASLPHQNCSLAKIHSSLGLEGQTLFNTLINVQKPAYSGQSGLKPAISMDITDYRDPAEFDLIFNVVDSSQTITANLHFWTTCISEAHALNIKATLMQVITSLLQSSNRPVSELKFFAEHHGDQLREWNPSNPHIEDTCLHQQFERQAAIQPNAPAICATAAECNWTYYQLNKLATKLAAHLSSLGVVPEMAVPFCFDKSPWTIVTILAIMKAGGACVALDPSFPIRRLKDMIAMTKTRIIISEDKYTGLFHELDEVSVVSVNPDLWDNLPSAERFKSSVKPNNAAWVNFTSGSTGVPKGNVLEHKMISSAVWHHCAIDPLDKNTRALHFSSYTFDMSFAEIFITLNVGGCLCVPTNDERMNHLAATIRRFNVNWAYMTPTVSNLLTPEEVPSLKIICLGGEPVLDTLVRKWKNKAKLIATYGPSECSIAISRSEVVGYGNGQLGPASGSLLWIVNPTNNNELMPIGAPGELLIEGPLVGREYLDESLNGAAFVVDPAWTKEFTVPGTPSFGRRMYRTGDIVRFNTDGSMVMLGRKDAQAKIHGQRVDLGEVEHHITATPAIKHAACVIAKSGPFKGKLTALLSSMDLADAVFGSSDVTMTILDGKEARTNVVELRSWLENRVPAYMIPRAWIFLENVPVTLNGKLDRRALLRWLENIDDETYDTILGLDRNDASTGHSGEMTPMEASVLKAWSHVLNVPESQISFSQSFFSLGGDSISAIQVSSRLRNLDIRVSMHDIMQYRIISEIAKRAKYMDNFAANMALQAESFDTSFSLTPIQKRYFDDMPAGQDHFNQSFLLKIKQYTEPEILKKAVEAIVSRHSALRSRFSQNLEGEWSQMIIRDVQASLRFRVTAGLSSIQDCEPIVEEAQRSLSIASGPVFAAEVFLLDDGTQFLFLVAHHLVVDLVSWRVILEDLEEAIKSGSVTSVPTTPFQTWSQLQTAYAEGEEGSEDLKPSKALPFQVEPADFEFWGVPDPRSYGSTVMTSFELDTDTTTALIGTSNLALATEPVDILMAAILDSYRSVFPQRKLPALFTEGHGREPWNTEIDIARTVGWFTTMFPVAIDLGTEVEKEAATGFTAILRRVKDAARSVPAKGWRYFTSRYLTAAGKEAFAGHEKMEILFNHLGQYQQLEREDAVFEQAISPFELGDFSTTTPRSALFEIISVVERGRLVLKFGYSSELKHQSSIETWIQACKASLEAAAQSLPSFDQQLASYSDFPLLSGRLSYSQLDGLLSKCASGLNNLGTDASGIEDIYPCSPMQEGILFSRSRQEGLYETADTFKVGSSSGSAPFSMDRFQAAIEKVVARHQAFRTWFVESDGSTPYVQLVLKQVTAPILRTQYNTVEDIFRPLPRDTPRGHAALGYRFILSEIASTGDTYCKLEINHALVDGLSMKVLVDDLLLAYDELLPVSETLPLYGDFIAYLESRPAKESLDYWTALVGDLEPCHLPTYNGLSDQKPQFKSVHLELDGTVAQLVQKICRDYETTMATVMSAVWALVLRAYVGTDTVTFGYLSSGRSIPVPQVESIMGPLITMMISRVDLDPDMPLTQMLQDLHGRFLNSMTHQHTSLSEIQHASTGGRQRGPLFNTVVNIQKRNFSTHESPASIQLEPLDVYDPNEYDVTLNVEHNDDKMTMELSYWTSCLSDEHAELMQHTVLHTLESLVHNITGKVSDLDLLSNSHKTLIMRWNSEMPETVDTCVHELIERNVETQPGKEAISTSNFTMTYLELDRLSSRLAGHLAYLGVGPEVMVPFCFDKSPWTIVVMYAILKAGGSCAALSPEFPDARLASMIESTKADLVVVDSKYASRLGGLVMKVLPIDASITSVAAMVDYFGSLSIKPTTRAKPKNPAFIAFTSGSTGTPKGICLEHAAMSTSIHNHGPLERLSSDSRVLQFSSYTFDVSIGEIFTTLTYGGTVCVPSEYERMNDLAAFMKSQHVNFAHLTPTVAALINPDDISLEVMVLSGEAIPANLARTWSTRTTLIPTYGPAECSITSSGLVVDPANIQDGALGWPCSTLLWVTDPEDYNKLVPIGCIGELLIEGPNMARGYLNPEQTAKAFIFDPAWTDDVGVPGVGKGRRMYRTGDLVRYNLDGSLLYLGRKDAQVKIHGQRMDLGEIEHHVSTQVSGQPAALVPKKGYWAKKLVAVFPLGTTPLPSGQDLQAILTEDTAKRVGELRTVLQAHLPGYMMPRAWIPIQSLPLTPNGKLNRRAIQDWVESMDKEICESLLALGTEIKSAQSLSDVEKQLVSVWADVLAIPEMMIDINAPFFSLGGDSISAMHAASRLRAQGVQLAVHDILRHRTITALASIVESTTKDSIVSRLQNIVGRPESRHVAFPLTPTQAMHFQTKPDNMNHFNRSSLLKLQRKFTSARMQAGLMSLVKRHSMLSARFKPTADGTWTQYLVDEATDSLHFSHEKFSSVKDAKLSLATMNSSLDIQQGPIMAASLMDIQSKTGSHQFLYLVVHQLVADETSLQILLQDLEDILLGQPACSTPVSFQTWAIAQEEYAKHETLPRKVLPFDMPAQQDFAGYWGMNDCSNNYADTMSLEFTIDEDTTSLLLGKANNALKTETMEVLLAILFRSFSDVFKDRALPIIFCEAHGRESLLDQINIDISKTVGAFTTMFPIVVREDRRADVLHTLRSVKDWRRMLPGNGMPYFASRYSSVPMKDEKMEIIFSYQEATDSGDSQLFEQIPVDGVQHIDPCATRRALFEISATIIEDELCIHADYSSHVARKSEIATWMQEFEAAITSAATLLAQARPIPALLDYPLLGLDDYATLDSLVDSCMAQSKILDASLIESIHPCSPMQEGILLSTSRSANFYDVEAVWKVATKSSLKSVDMQRLKMACENVAARHDIFRTYLVESHYGRSAFLQVVLKRVETPVNFVKHDDLKALMDQPQADTHAAGVLPYAFTICEVASGDIYLRLDINHALFDGITAGVLVRDLLTAYDGGLSLTGASYRDFIAHLQAQPKDKSLKFWKEALEEATPCHFPRLNETEVGDSPVHINTHVELAANQSEQVRAFCKQHNTTLSNFMSAIWAIVLPSFVANESSNVAFGYLASGRDIPIEGVHDIMGPMITMLICKANVEPQTKVLDLIEEMQQDFTKSWPHQHCSLGEIHHALGLSGTTLFNTIINLQKGGGEVEEVPGDIIFQPENVDGPSEYDIALNIHDVDGKQVWLSLSYWTSCISEEQAAVLSHTIKAVVTSVLTDPYQAISNVTLVDDYHMKLLETWNTNIPEPIFDCIHDAFERQVQLHPDAPAVCSTDPQVSLSYQQLNDMANALALSLNDLGVGPESLVPFCMDKSPWTPVAMIAILKAGGACVALDPNQPIKRLQGIIKDSGASVVLAAPQHQALFIDIVPHTLPVGQELLSALNTQEPRAERPEPAKPNNPAFVIFTSGSTGTPKGIVVEHGAFCSSARSHAPALHIESGSRVLQFASHTYDLSIAETFTTLMVGGCICVPSEYDRLNRLAEAINAMSVDWMFLTPTVAALLQPEQVPSIRTLVLGGEHASQNNFSTWGGRPGICLINSYGPAECSIWTNANVGVKTTSDTSNIGGRLGCSLWVVDPRNHNRLLPMYARGELVIGGPTLARGYLHDPVKTDAAFIEAPAWLSDSRQRLYKSGDLVYYNLDGTLSINGRKDQQVKVHGHRIELGDIDQNIARIPLVEHAVVQLPRAGPLQGRLVAVAALKERSAGGAQILKIIQGSDNKNDAAKKLHQIRSELETQLPKHMLPTMWVLVEKMPLLTSGKLDKRTTKTWLEEIDEDTYSQIKSLSTSDTASTLTLPENATESILQEIWAEVLRCAAVTIGTTQSFLSLGGDSISAMQVVSRARNAGINIFAQDIFRLKTIQNLAKQAASAGSVAQLTKKAGRFGLLPVAGGDLDQFVGDCVSRLQLDDDVSVEMVEDIFPCSPMQEGILISQARQKDQYQVKALFEVLVQSGEVVDVDRLEKAWIMVAQRHQAMRSCFVDSALDRISFLQVVLKQVTVPVLKLECVTLEDYTNTAEVNEYAENGPPYRFSICKLPSGVVWCQLLTNHVLDDGSSLRTLMRDVCLAYDDMLPSENPPLYSDFISYIRAQPKEVGLNYWKGYLDGVVPSHFPVLATKTNEPPADDSVNRWIEGDKAVALHKLCEEYDITMADIFKTVWAIVLGSFLGTDSVCFGYLASGRDAPVPDVHNILGPLINMLVHRAEVEPSATLIDLCKNANEGYTHALDHQHCSLKEIMHRVGGAGQTANLFNSIVNVQKGVTTFFVNDKDSMDHRTITLRNRQSHDPTEYDVSVDVIAHTSSIHVMLSYWSSVLSKEQAIGIADIVLAVAERLVTDPLQTVGQLDLCTKRDMDLLYQWNDVPLAVEGRCLHNVIEDQAAARPDATAIVCDVGSITFGQLDGFANQLAHRLVDLGAGPGSIIPICFEKSIWGIVSMLAILKSGAACTALEPSHPMERLQMMLQDTEAPFVLASSMHTGLMDEAGMMVVTINDDSMGKLLASDAAAPPCSNVKAEDVAFVVYTSGSTGTPKGAIIEHRNLHAVSHTLTSHGISRESRVAHFSSYAYDVSIEETIIALTLGACVCIISEEDRLGDLTGALNRMQVTWADLTPTVLRTLEPEQLPHVKTMMVGGELLTEDVVAKWHDKVELRNSYGPCECAIYCAATDPLKAGDRGVVIGKPVQAQLWVVNAENDQLLVPVGAVGELVIQGPLVGRGYLKSPEKTKAAFIDAPAWAPSSTGSRIYKTGDLARWNSDGTISYLGRKDNQVKIHGQRIELGEIETQIALSAERRARTVMAAVPSSGQLKQRLVAFLALGDMPQSARQASTGTKTTNDSVPVIRDDPAAKAVALEHIADIRDAVKKILPRHMVPNLWIPVYDIPTLPSGKINRRLIKQWLESMDQDLYTELMASQQEVVAVVPPSSEMEEILQRIWSQVLNLPVDSISTDQSFFALGGDSVLAMQLIARARGEGYTVKVRDVFQQGTIAALAPHCEPTTGSATGLFALNDSARMVVEDGDLILDPNAPKVQDIYPASPMQHSIVNIQKTQKNAWYANWIVAVHPSPQHSKSVRLTDIAVAWQTVVNRHAILRTVFQTGSRSGRLYQVVLKNFIAPVSYLTETSPDPADIFNIDPDIPEDGVPQHRMVLAETMTGDVYIQLQLSHTLYDAVALSILWHDLQVAYTSGVFETPSPSYRNFISYIEGMDKAKTMDFWKEYLTGAEPCNFPSLVKPQKRTQKSPQLSGEFTNILVPFGKTNLVRAFCKEHAITTANLFQAAWALVLREFTQMDDVNFGFMMSGRDAPIPDVDSMTGPFINILPCRVKTSGHKDLTSMLRGLQGDFADVLMNQGCSIEDIQAVLEVKDRLYNTFLNMQRVTGQAPYSQSSLSFEELRGHMTDEYAISVYVVDADDDVSISMCYWTSILSTKEANMIGRALQRALDVLFQCGKKGAPLSLSLS